MENYLIIDTPRAGRWNHCLVVSNSTPDNEAKIRNYVEHARQSEIGDGYLAVRREVTQPTTGRAGIETLVLVGNISQGDQEKVKNQMRGMFGEVDALIESGIDWGNESQPTLVKDGRLAELMETHQLQFASSKLSTRSLGRRVLFGMVLGVLVVLLAVILVVFRRMPTSGVPASDQTAELPSPTTDKSMQMRISQLHNGLMNGLTKSTDLEIQKLKEVVEDLEKRFLETKKVDRKNDEKELLDRMDQLFAFFAETDPYISREFDDGCRKRLVEAYDKGVIELDQSKEGKPPLSNIPVDIFRKMTKQLNTAVEAAKKAKSFDTKVVGLLAGPKVADPTGSDWTALYQRTCNFKIEKGYCPNDFKVYKKFVFVVNEIYGILKEGKVDHTKDPLERFEKLSFHELKQVLENGTDLYTVYDSLSELRTTIEALNVPKKNQDSSK